MKRNSVLDEIYRAQPKEIQAAIDELESRGLSWCGHFGYANAECVLVDMNEAFEAGRLYEYMRGLGL